jgi:hypothetical protein
MANICIFCFQGPNNPKPWCTNNPGHGCTYGFHHEFPEDVVVMADKTRPVKKLDKQVCIKCNVHAKNPTSASNGCQHEYPA